ncbi:MAG: hypothetical protein ABI132_09380 [Rhodanobacteraceae bacterium]
MSMNPRSAVSLSVACALLLAGCAGHPQRSETSTPTGSEQPVAPAPVHETRTTRATHHATTPEPAMQTPAGPGDMVGVASCDQYLSTYKACHRAAGIYAPGQINARYDMMHETLQRDSRDPAKRVTLDARCRSLAKQLTEALHGKSCNAAPASSSTSNMSPGAM